MTAERPEPDADRLAALLRTVEPDAPTPDAAALERLREASSAAFGTVSPAPGGAA